MSPPAGIGADARAWLMQKSAPLTVHYGRSLQLADGDLPTPERVTIPTRHGRVRCEIYRPPTSVGDGPRPVLLHLHGGAFIMRHPRMDDFWTRYLALEAGVAAIAVDYATAPQARYPVAQEQVYDVLTYVVDHGSALGVDGTRVGIGGFSAGGQLAAAACLQSIAAGHPRPAFALLGVPSLDVAQEWSDKRPVGTPMLGRGILDLVRSTYFRDAARRTEPLASPLLAPSVAGFPPTMLITAEVDLLRREGDAFARRLSEVGVAVEHVVVPGHDHYFLDETNAPTLLARMAGAVREALVDESGHSG